MTYTPTEGQRCSNCGVLRKSSGCIRWNQYAHDDGRSCDHWESIPEAPAPQPRKLCDSCEFRKLSSNSRQCKPCVDHSLWTPPKAPESFVMNTEFKHILDEEGNLKKVPLNLDPAKTLDDKIDEWHNGDSRLSLHDTQGGSEEFWDIFSKAETVLAEVKAGLSVCRTENVSPEEKCPECFLRRRHADYCSIGRKGKDDE